MNRRAGVLLVVCLLAAVLLVSRVGAGDPAKAGPDVQAVTNPRFGVVEAHDAPAQAAEIGAGWGRARFHWASIQPDGPAEWIDAELSDEELAGEIDAGREVVGLLIGIPGWAADENGLPSGLYLPPDDENNLWAGFVRELVTRYEGRIDHWIVWNEPDIWDPAHAAFTWPGTLDDYVQLLKVTYLTAKDANPDAVIHLAAVSHWWDVEYGRELFFPQLLDALVAEPDAAANNTYYDVATMHIYFNPASVYDLLEEYEGYQAERGLDKPFWLMETNAPPTSDPAWPVEDVTFRVSLLEQAAYMPQAFSLALAAGAERIEVYKLIDTPGDLTANPEPFGLVRADGSARPGFGAAKIAMQMLADAENAVWNEQGVVAQVVVEKPGAVMRVLWDRVPGAQVASVPALAESAVLVDMWGNETAITPQDGAYTVPLYAGECQETVGDYCMIGGPAVYLVEDVPGGLPDDLPGLLTVEPMAEKAAEVPLSESGLTPFLPLGTVGAVGAVVLLLAAAAVALIWRRR